jgi:hypothetical protein|tara:strand:- start:3195 stop:4097 length:903 start_codon:yes stop_codon:yes gene_type:complete
MIYIFQTKWSSDRYLKAFVRQYSHKFFETEEMEGEQYYRNRWPEWNGKLEDTDRVIEVAFQGIIRNTKTVYDCCIKNNIPFYYFDQPYFFYTGYADHPDFRDSWYRICKNNVQKTYISLDPKHEHRFKRIYASLENRQAQEQIRLRDWRTGGNHKHILVIPPSFHTARWYGIDRHIWTKNIVSRLKTYTDRKILVRPKYMENKDWGEKEKRPLSKDLKDCWAMVSWHSMCASEAIVKGIPCFTSEHSPAAPVSLRLNKLSMIEKPIVPDREKWLWSLVGSQFTFQDMRGGTAYRYVKEEL